MLIMAFDCILVLTLLANFHATPGGEAHNMNKTASSTLSLDGCMAFLEKSEILQVWKCATCGKGVEGPRDAPGEGGNIAGVEVGRIEVRAAVAAIQLVACRLPGVPPLERVRERVCSCCRTGLARASPGACRARTLPAGRWGLTVRVR